MDTITFESLPAAVAEMKSTIDEMNRTLNRLMGDKYIPSDEPDRLMPLDEFREYLPEKRKPAAQTVYQWVLDRKVPYEKYSGRLWFRKSSIDKWLANGRRI